MMLNNKVTKYQKQYEKQTGDKESDSEFAKNEYEIFEHTEWKDRYISYLESLLKRSDNSSYETPQSEIASSKSAKADFS